MRSMPPCWPATAALWLWAVLAVGAVGLVAGATAGRGAALAQERAAVRYSPAAITFLLAWLVGGLALYYIAVLDRNAFNVRYASFVTPALYALLGVGLAGFARWWRPLPAVLLVFVAGRPHPRRVRRHLRQPQRPRAHGRGDRVAARQHRPRRRHLRRPEVPLRLLLPAAIPSMPTPHSRRPSDAAPARYLFVDINTIDQRLTEWAGDARRVFWVQWFESDTDPRHAVHFLLDKVWPSCRRAGFPGLLHRLVGADPADRVCAGAGPCAACHCASTRRWRRVAVSLPAAPLAPGDALPVAIRWQRVPGGAIDRPLKARVALYDADGDRLAQADERLLNDRHRAPDQWQPADQPLNVYSLAMPRRSAAGRLRRASAGLRRRHAGAAGRGSTRPAIRRASRRRLEIGRSESRDRDRECMRRSHESPISDSETMHTMIEQLPLFPYLETPGIARARRISFRSTRRCSTAARRSMCSTPCAAAGSAAWASTSTRFEADFAALLRRSARGQRQQRHDGAAPGAARAGHRPRRRGDRAGADLCGLGQCRPLHRRHARLCRCRPRDLDASTRPTSRGASRRARGRSCRSISTATRRDMAAINALAEEHDLLRRRRCGRSARCRRSASGVTGSLGDMRRLQLLCQQDHHHRRRRHAHHRRRRRWPHAAACCATMPCRRSAATGTTKSASTTA